MPGYYLGNYFLTDPAGGAAAPSPSPTPAGTGTGSYWGYAYFGGWNGLGWWGPGSPAGVVLPTPSIGDVDIYDDIVARLVATGAFDADGVIFGPAPADSRATAGMAAVAVVTPTRPGRESPDGTAGRMYRELEYTITVVARDREKVDGYRDAWKLERAARNAINRKRLAGATLPWKTSLVTSTDVVDRHPDYAVTLSGRAGYAYDVRGGLPEAE